MGDKNAGPKQADLPEGGEYSVHKRRAQPSGANGNRKSRPGAFMGGIELPRSMVSTTE